MRRPIFLIGYMACGKTTLGTALAAAADVEFVDLDHLIEHRFGCSVSQIFATVGEAAFRQAEADALKSLVESSDRQRIIGCGGGTPCREENLQLMLRAGTVVLLRANRQITLQRILDAPGQRPRFIGLNREQAAARIDADLTAREPFYCRAHREFDSSRLDTADQIRQSVAEFIRLFGLTPKQSAQ